jgi:hypothetical protein
LEPFKGFSAEYLKQLPSYAAGSRQSFKQRRNAATLIRDKPLTRVDYSKLLIKASYNAVVLSHKNGALMESKNGKLTNFEPTETFDPSINYYEEIVQEMRNLYKGNISDQEADEAARNLIGFCKTLLEIDAALG